MLMALGSSGRVSGAMVGRFAPVNNEDRGSEVDQTAHDASERVSTAARLPVREPVSSISRYGPQSVIKIGADWNQKWYIYHFSGIYHFGGMEGLKRADGMFLW